MPEVTLENLPKATVDMFNRGFTALERGNLDYAIEMLSSCVEAEPSFLRGWKFLRAAEVKRYRKKPITQLTQAMTMAVRFPSYLIAVALLKAKKTVPALLRSGRLLRQDPVNPLYGKLFAEAALQMELPDLAILTLEAVRDNRPDDVTVLSWLGAFYQQSGRMRSARECFERLCEISPNDPAALKKLKDAMALDSMNSDGWEQSAEKGGSFRDMLKNEEEAALLEQGSKSAKSDTGLDALIADMKSKIEDEPNNINFRRGLANLYLQRYDFDQAISVLEDAVQLNPGDPELERAVTNAHLRQFDHRLEQLRKQGDEEAVAEIETQRLQYKFDDLQARVERYPNDLQLRFEWGIMLLENDYVNEAIQQLQLAQRSARNRVQALYHLGVCFRAKKQYAIACRQLDAALEELPIMDANKKKVLYERAELAELMNEPQKAMDLFMQIYQVDISYRDVARKVEESAEES